MSKKVCMLLVLAGVILQSKAQSPSVADCLGAIPICQPVYLEGRSPAGGGFHREIHPVRNCMREERNSLWYTFTVGRSGDFGFVLTPNELTDDYDWVLFDITYADCEDLFEHDSLIVSCNAAGNEGCAGPTGADGSTAYNTQGFNCGNMPPDGSRGFSPFNALVSVEAGNTYALCVSNFSGSTNGYRIDFSMSGDIGIFDDQLPTIEEVVFPEACNIWSFEVRLSEPVLCSTVDSVNFQLTVGDRAYPLEVDASNCNAGGLFSRSFRLILFRPLERGVPYVLDMQPTVEFPVTDLCANSAVPHRFEGWTPPDSPLELGPDTALCTGQQLTLDLSGFGFQSVEWQDGSTGEVFIVDRPGTYSAAVLTECGIFRDELEVAFESTAPQVDLGPDRSICPGASLAVSLPAGPVFYLWEDGHQGGDYLITGPGTYRVTASNGCGSSADEMTVALFPDLTISVSSDTFLCPGETLLLTAVASSATHFQWKGEPPGASIAISAPGEYTVIAANDCDTVAAAVTVRECERCEVYIPNAFSPNNDGVNDLFQPFSDCPLSDFQMRIYDRWGSLLLDITDPDTGWDGLVRGRPAGPGLYVWVAQYQVEEDGRLRKVEEAGELMLIR